MKKYKKYIVFGVLFLGSYLIGFVGGFLLAGLAKIRVRNEIVFDLHQQEDKLEVWNSYNILLLGYGGEGHEGGYLSDVIILLSIKPKEKKAVFISIPRDLWVEIPVRSDFKEHYKINAAYSIGNDDKNFPLKEPQYKGEYGGGAMAKKVVSQVVGFPVEYCIALDFSGFKDLIDSLGGVDVEVPVTFDDYFYPIKGRENDTCGKSSAEIAELHEKFSDTQLHHQFECRYEHIHFDKGKTFMDGEKALKFVRSRASLEHGGDFARSQRQKYVILAIKDKLLSLESIKNIDDFYLEFSKMLRTDIDLSVARELFKVFGDPGEYELNFLNLSTENVLIETKSKDGQFILIPKEGEDVWVGVQKYLSEAKGS